MAKHWSGGVIMTDRTFVRTRYPDADAFRAGGWWVVRDGPIGQRLGAPAGSKSDAWRNAARELRRA